MLVTAASACDSAALIRRSVRDATILGADDPSADVARREWSLPANSARYDALLTLLTRTSHQRQELGESGNEYVWPRAASERGSTDESAWSEAVAAGLVTESDARRMKRSGYTGWHLHISADGRFVALIHGA